MSHYVGSLAILALFALWAAAPTLAEQSTAPDTQDHSTKMKNTSSQEIRPTVREALDHAKRGVEAGQKDDSQALVSHAEKAMAKAKEAQSKGHNEYLNGGVHELGEAIEHGRKKQTKDATEHMMRSIMRLSQAADLQIPE